MSALMGIPNVLATENKTYGAASTAADELPKVAFGPRSNYVPGGGTSNSHDHYPSLVKVTAVPTAPDLGGACVKWGGSAVGAAVVTDEYFPPGQPILKRLGDGQTHYRVIASDGASAGTLRIEVLEPRDLLA